jgi:Multicopper oxidase
VTSTTLQFLLALYSVLADRLLDGFTRNVYLINDQQPGPLIEVEEGDDIEVFVRNDLPVENTIHWHGEHLQPWWQILLCHNLFQILRSISICAAKANTVAAGLLQRGTPGMDGVPGVSQV